MRGARGRQSAIMRTEREAWVDNRRCILVFVDGLGIGPNDPAVNPIARGACPLLRSWIAGPSAAVDARLGVPGLPQSATGQATLYTGVNAARLIGRHREGFPNAPLRDLIRRGNLFQALLNRGDRPTFANAYWKARHGAIERGFPASVTTVMTLSALGTVRTPDDLAAGRAVYHDITRRHLRTRGYEGPLVEPEEAAGHLVSIAEEHTLTLFEYFMTDLTAHRGGAQDQENALRDLDRFLAALQSFPSERNLLVLISDHGNIEDSRVRTHTRNPVPLIAFGAGADRLRNAVRSLVDFTPRLLEVLMPTPISIRLNSWQGGFGPSPH
jgi:2,3-bisphosphoglycerate-independent phosphoglycerate mutase